MNAFADATGSIEIRDRILRKELIIGVANGLALGLLFGIIAYVMRGNFWLSLVAGSALGINVLVAGIAGGILPLIIKSLGKDPAMMTGPFLTTITDPDIQGIARFHDVVFEI